MKPMASSNTIVQFTFTSDPIINNGIVSVGGGDTTQNSEKQYNYRGDLYSIGAASQEITDLTITMYWNAFNKLRKELDILDGGTGVLRQDLMGIRFEMLQQIDAGSTVPDNDFTKYQRILKDCFVQNWTQPTIEKDVVGLMTDVTIMVGSVEEATSF